MGSMTGVLMRPNCSQGSLSRKGDCTGNHTTCQTVLQGHYMTVTCVMQVKMITTKPTNERHVSETQ